MAAKPSFELRLRVLHAVYDAPGNSMRERIKHVADKPFADALSGHPYRFTWRTISTWLYRHRKNGITTLENKTRSDKHAYRKVQVNQLAEAIHEVLPSLAHNKVGVIPKSVLYRILLARGLFARSQMAPTTFYRIVRSHHLMSDPVLQKQRLSFAMQFANQLWQADTLYGPTISASSWSGSHRRRRGLHHHHARGPFHLLRLYLLGTSLYLTHQRTKNRLRSPWPKRYSKKGVKVWFDTFTLTVGDSLRRSIDRGLAQSRFGIVVLSEAFFQKQWPQLELDGLVARESAGVKVILPVWHKIEESRVRNYSPMLADRVAVSSARGLDYVVQQLLQVIKPGE